MYIQIYLDVLAVDVLLDTADRADTTNIGRTVNQFRHVRLQKVHHRAMEPTQASGDNIARERMCGGKERARERERDLSKRA
jgi:hypothetical protein